MRYLHVKLDKYATEWSIKRRERKTNKVYLCRQSNKQVKSTKVK